MVALTFIIYCYDFAILGSRQRSEIAGLPMLSIYIAWPLAGLTWLVFLIERGYDILYGENGEAHGSR